MHICYAMRFVVTFNKICLVVFYNLMNVKVNFVNKNKKDVKVIRNILKAKRYITAFKVASFYILLALNVI